MFSDDSHDRLRLRLNDESGVLRFVEFEILNPSRCRDVEQMLREYVLGRALADVDLGYLCKLSCNGNDECLRGVIYEVHKYQQLFAKKDACGSEARKRVLA